MTEPDDATPPTLDNRRRRLIFRAQHRGTFENDLLLGDFVKQEIATLTPQQLTDLESILDLPDPDLANWLTGRQPIPPHADTPMLQRIRAAALNRRA
jgi:antitoxin CptB